MKTNHTIDFKLYTTNTMDKKAQLDFLSVYNRVFDENEGLDFFARKFRDNIYGTSYIAMAYEGDTPCGVRTYWRMDIEGVEAYEICDVSVLPEYRRRGILGGMVKAASELDAHYQFSFPNPTSRSTEAYYGFTLKNTVYRKPIWHLEGQKNKLPILSPDHLKWVFKGRYPYKPMKGWNALLRPEGNDRYTLLARFENGEEKGMTKVTSGKFFTYTEKRTPGTFLTRYTFPVFEKTTGPSPNHIPVYLSDYLMKEGRR